MAADYRPRRPDVPRPDIQGYRRGACPEEAPEAVPAEAPPRLTRRVSFDLRRSAAFRWKIWTLLALSIREITVCRSFRASASSLRAMASAMFLAMVLISLRRLLPRIRRFSDWRMRF